MKRSTLWGSLRGRISVNAFYRTHVITGYIPTFSVHIFCNIMNIEYGEIFMKLF
jgi:hypothetical protein